MLYLDIVTHSYEGWARSPLGGRSAAEVSAYLIVSGFAWGIVRAIYLLYFHPLASFPGPYQAIFSTWWLYAVSKSGQTEEVLEQLHKKYNTRALRIGPNELHITDPGLYHTIYSQRHTYTKQQYFYDAFNTPHSVFVETDPNLHRVRRKMLSNFFSKMSIRSMEGILASKIQLLCKRLSETKGDGPINLYHAFRCLTADFITEVAFGESYNLLIKAEDNTFNTPFLGAFDLASDSLWALMYFPILRIIVNNTPPVVAAKLSRSAAGYQGLVRAVADTIASFRRFKSSGKSLDHEVVFDSMSHLEDKVLNGEATDILVAGSDTTATTLAISIQEMIKSPNILKRLKDELKEAEIATEQDCKLVKLEQLPYLTACVKEAMRYAMAVPGRLPRVVPNGAEPLIIDGKVVPAGAIVGMSVYTMHSDKSIWGQDAKSFNPDRWQIGDAKELDKYLVTFSKGARQCLGINLAYAEVTLTLAMLANRFHFTFDETLKKSDLKRVDNFTMGFEGAGLCVVVHEDN
ncbi:cytochrome P450 [Pyrenochaeta sp. DS3sAY3a]|nr:cytochrome P450 [Pyrenochaeta sp. DS3sAY3a]